MFLIPVFFIAALLWVSKLLYYIAIGLFTAIVFCCDKRAAIKGKYRIPENQLLFLSFLGGAFGALITIFLIRHKSSKPQIYLPVFLFAGIHTILIILF